MSATSARPSSVAATTLEVLPSFGIAYLVDDHNVGWAVTKSTRGLGLHSLRPGQRVQLSLEHDAEFSLVSEYQTLD